MKTVKMKNYWKPTPKRWRKLGDAMLAVSAYAQAQQMFTGQDKLLTALAIVGLIGKFLSNFFTEDETTA